MSKKYFISPCLWFDTQAEEVVEFYTSLFPNSLIKNILRYGKEGKEIQKKPEGSVLTIDFTLDEVPFVALNGTPAFQHNESISLFVYCETDERINFLYEKFSESGSVNMPLDKYDWSSKYAWVKDKFGVSWQLDISKSNSSQKIVPSLLFVNNKFNLIKNAANFYTSIFPDSKILIEQVFENINEIENGTLLFAQLSLNGYLINLMSGGKIKHNFDFNESISFIVNCNSQEEIDYYWSKLTEGGEEIECGWLKEKFGIFWQIVPEILNELLVDSQKSDKVMREIFKMKKLELKKLLEAAK